MSTTDLSTALTIAVTIFTIIGGIYGALKVVNTYRKNQREVHLSKVQKRIEYLQEQMKTLQEAAADFHMQANNPSMPGKYIQAIATIQATMLSVGDSELDTIAQTITVDKSAEFFFQNKDAISNGIKRLARIIAAESTK